MSGLAIASIAGLATIQDAGRAGRMHEGIPPGGAIVPELLARANEAAGNAPGGAAIELFGAMRVVARGAIVIAADDGVPHRLEDGDAFDLRAQTTRVRYLAMRGSIDVPRVLGGRGTLLVAGIGGLAGRALRKGDALDAACEAIAPAHSLAPASLDLDAPIRVIRGPDRDGFTDAFDVLTTTPFTLSPSSDRTGSRLVGAALARAHAERAEMAVSAPMVAGAIEVPPGGAPIVLGPDHPTTGGYPVIATVIRADLGRFAARRIGARVTFIECASQQ